MSNFSTTRKISQIPSPSKHLSIHLLFKTNQNTYNNCYLSIINHNIWICFLRYAKKCILRYFLLQTFLRILLVCDILSIYFNFHYLFYSKLANTSHHYTTVNIHKYFAKNIWLYMMMIISYIFFRWRNIKRSYRRYQFLLENSLRIHRVSQKERATTKLEMDTKILCLSS